MSYKNFIAFVVTTPLKIMEFCVILRGYNKGFYGSHDFIKFYGDSNLINIGAVSWNPLTIDTEQTYRCLLDIKQLSAKKSSNKLLYILIIKSFLTLNENNNIEKNYPHLNIWGTDQNMFKSKTKSCQILKNLKSLNFTWMEELPEPKFDISYIFPIPTCEE